MSTNANEQKADPFKGVLVAEEVVDDLEAVGLLGVVDARKIDELLVLSGSVVTKETVKGSRSV